MNCNDRQQQILLAQSGELDASRRHELEAHLGTCDACRAYRDDLESLTEKAGELLPAGEPTGQTLQSIHELASREAGHRRIAFPLPARQLLATAAILVLAVAGWMVMTGNESAVPAVEINDFDAIIVCMQEEELLEEGDETLLSRETEISELARQLLIIQGLNLEEEEDVLTGFEVLDPTGLQSRNTPASAAQKCV